MFVENFPQPSDSVTPPGFEGPSIYEAPGILLKQAWDGEFTPRTALRTIFDPLSLSPKELDSISSRMKERVGSNRVARGLVDVATNPWVWLFFLTSPVGVKGTADIFQIAKEGASPYAGQVSGLLGAMGLLNPRQLLRGTVVGAAVAQFQKGFTKVQASEEVRAYYDAVRKVARANGLDEVKGLDWTRYRAGSEAQRKARELSALVWAAVNRAHEDVVEFTFDVVKDQKGKVVGLKRNKVVRKKIVSSNPYLKLARIEGGTELVSATQRVLQRRADDLFGSTESLLRIYRGIKNATITGSGSRVAHKDVEAILGPLADLVREGDISFQEFEQMVRGTVLEGIRDNRGYFPRNVHRAFVGSDEILEESLPGVARTVAAIRAAGATRPRSGYTNLLDEADAALLDDVLGLDDEYRNLSRTKLEQVRLKSAAERSPYRLWQVNPQLSMDRYLDQTARTYAMFVQDVGEEVRRINKETRKLVTLRSERDVSYFGKSLKDKNGALFTEAIEEIEKRGDAPLGGFTIADVIHAEASVIRDKHAVEALTEVVIPHLMGRVGPKHTLAMGMLNVGKRMAQGFLNTDAAKAIRESHELGKSFVDGLQEWVDQPLSPNKVAGATHATASLLYSSHMALNAGLAMINGTQPFLYVGNWVGLPTLLSAYKNAFKEFFSYFEERLQQGFRPLSGVERAELYRKHFSLFEVDGRPVLGLSTGDVLETLEGDMFQTFSRASRPTSLTRRVLFEYPMKLFEKAELLNRNVAAHAAKIHADKFGLPRSRLASFIEEMVSETQFGGSFMDLPVLFDNRTGLLGNPLIRQFLQFPLRSFTAWVHTGPRLGGRTGAFTAGSMKGFLNDTVRGMAISAVGYELGKNLLNI
ncbi:MAG: hypothetical protein D6722_10185, partial [Bacteroidetes bacterium]